MDLFQEQREYLFSVSKIGYSPGRVVYPNPADNSISAKTGKTAMNSATSSCHMAQGNALARFHRVRCSSASKAPRTAHPLALYPRSLWCDLRLLGSHRLPVVR